MMQTLDFSRTVGFEIDDDCFGAMLSKVTSNLGVSGGHKDRLEDFRETDRQIFSCSGVFLIEDYAEWFHDFPLTTPPVRGDLGCAGNPPRRRGRCQIRSSCKSLVPYLRKTFSAGGSKGSVCSCPFCLSRISTFPSASSSCFRQVAESCMPSSNSVRDFSSGTSPFSSS